MDQSEQVVHCSNILVLSWATVTVEVKDRKSLWKTTGKVVQARNNLTAPLCSIELWPTVCKLLCDWHHIHAPQTRKATASPYGTLRLRGCGVTGGAVAFLNRHSARPVFTY